MDKRGICSLLEVQRYVCMDGFLWSALNPLLVSENERLSYTFFGRACEVPSQVLSL